MSKGLYVHRPLLNGHEMFEWAMDNKLPHVVPANKMHVTQVYSRKDVKLPNKLHNILRIREHGDRQFTRLGDEKEALVLHFKSPELSHRFVETKLHGAEWDYPEYKPHVSLSYKAGEFDHSKLQIPKMDLLLGPEIHEELDPDWVAHNKLDGK